MSQKGTFVDDAGDRVLRFISAAHNLSRLSELTDEIVSIAKSDAWRRYRTAVGTDQWRACELDYFLISCDLSYDDVSRIMAYTREGAALAPLMDREAPTSRRRALIDAAADWHAPTPETLLERAQRLGWTKSATSGDLRVAPVPPRARALQVHGMTMDEHARTSRAKRLSKARRTKLEAVVKRIRGEISDDVERLYVIDRLREIGRQRDKAVPKKSG